jgi:Phage integrase family
MSHGGDNLLGHRAVRTLGTTDCSARRNWSQNRRTGFAANILGWQHSGWDGSDILHVRTNIWRGREMPGTKTAAGCRDVFLCSALVKVMEKQAEGRNGFLFGSDPDKPLSQNAPAKALAKLGIRGFHSLRRFRTTRLREVGCPEEIIRAEIGHASSSMTDHYSKLARNAALRREWSEKSASVSLYLPVCSGTASQSQRKVPRGSLAAGSCREGASACHRAATV